MFRASWPSCYSGEQFRASWPSCFYKLGAWSDPEEQFGHSPYKLAYSLISVGYVASGLDSDLVGWLFWA